MCTELRRPAASSMLGPRPSTAPAPQRPLTMLPQQPDPWVIKKKRWLEAQHIRAAAVRRYTSGGAATATHRAASLENLEPVALVGGGSATMASPFARDAQSMSALHRRRPRSAAGGSSMIEENAGTRLKNELAARGKRVQAERKKRFEAVMAMKEAAYAELKEEAAVKREAESKVRARVRKSKLKKVAANIAADERRRAEMKIKLQARLAAEARVKDVRAEEARIAEIARIKRDEKRRAMRAQVKLEAQEAYELNKEYWAPMTKGGGGIIAGGDSGGGGYLLEPHPVNVGLEPAPRALSETANKDPREILDD